jgi:hypothetical protein
MILLLLIFFALFPLVFYLTSFTPDVLPCTLHIISSLRSATYTCLQSSQSQGLLVQKVELKKLN